MFREGKKKVLALVSTYMSVEYTIFLPSNPHLVSNISSWEPSSVLNCWPDVFSTVTFRRYLRTSSLLEAHLILNKSSFRIYIHH